MAKLYMLNADGTHTELTEEHSQFIRSDGKFEFHTELRAEPVEHSEPELSFDECTAEWEQRRDAHVTVLKEHGRADLIRGLDEMTFWEATYMMLRPRRKKR